MSNLLHGANVQNQILPQEKRVNRDKVTQKATSGEQKLNILSYNPGLKTEFHISYSNLPKTILDFAKWHSQLCSGSDDDSNDNCNDDNNDKVDPAMMAALMAACSVIQTGANTEEVSFMMMMMMISMSIMNTDVDHDAFPLNMDEIDCKSLQCILVIFLCVCFFVVMLLVK